MKQLFMTSALICFLFSQIAHSEFSYECLIEGEHTKIVINPGTLTPNHLYEFFYQPKDSAIFEGPIAMSYANNFGQLEMWLPQGEKGDRYLTRDFRNKDASLVIECPK